MKRTQSNIERITEYITFGSPMNQIFLVDAVYKLAELVLKDREDTLKQMKNGFVSGEAWIKAAEDWMASKEKTVACCDMCGESDHKPIRTFKVRNEDAELCPACAKEEGVF